MLSPRKKKKQLLCTVKITTVLTPCVSTSSKKRPLPMPSTLTPRSVTLLKARVVVRGLRIYWSMRWSLPAGGNLPLLR
jgi:hypothetical protein